MLLMLQSFLVLAARARGSGSPEHTHDSRFPETGPAYRVADSTPLNLERQYLLGSTSHER
jgi:hypothetical protein